MKSWRQSRRARGTLLAAIGLVAGLVAQPLLATSPAGAAVSDPSYYPSGPQLDVPVSTVTDGGWVECYRSTYGTALTPETLSGLLTSCSGDHLMLAGRETGSDTLKLLAAAPRADVLADSGSGNDTHNANGSEWYYSDAWSWGFAKGGDTVERDYCDIGSANPESRLCWHTGFSFGGWRVGTVTGLNYDGAYERIVYQPDGREAQRITYSSLAPTAAVPGDTYDVAAAGGASGNPVTFAIDAASSGVCSIDGTTVTFDHAGDCIVNASQAGNEVYAPAVRAQQTITVAKTPQTVTFTSSAPTGAVVGNSYDVTATGGASGNTVTFAIDSASSAVCSIAGATVTFEHPGDCTVNADQAGNDDYAAAAQAQQAIAVAQVATTTVVTVTPDTLTATVTPATGTGTPSGTVVFSVGGAEVGTAELVGGTATLTYETPAGASRTVAAVYNGDTGYTGSSASTVRNDPTIRATARSVVSKTRHGWYRAPVTVSFTCAANGSDLTIDCPAPVRISRQGAGMSVTRTIHAADGGVATATVRGINIDRAAPVLRIRGVRDGASYVGSAPRALCVARDALSGVVSCNVTHKRSGGQVRWVASATDRAGNRATTTVSATVSAIYFTGVRHVNGVFQVPAGRSYTLVVADSPLRPVYYTAAVAPRTPGPANKAFQKVGPNRWALGITIDPGMRAADRWNVGVKIGAKLHIVKLSVR